MATTVMSLNPSAAEMPSANSAQWVVSSTDELVIAFDASATENVIWKGIMPQIYADTSLVAHIWYKMLTATSGSVQWNVYVESIGDAESGDVNSFDGLNTSGAITVPVSASTMDVVGVSLTNADSAAAGEKVRIKLERDAASDTATGDAYVYLVEIRAA